MSEISNTSNLPIDKESIRISAVRKLQVLDSQFEVSYQAVTKLAATISDVPVAMITFVDDQTIWIKSAIGVTGVTQVPRKDAFCGWVVTNDEYLEVPNTSFRPQPCLSSACYRLAQLHVLCWCTTQATTRRSNWCGVRFRH